MEISSTRIWFFEYFPRWHLDEACFGLQKFSEKKALGVIPWSPHQVLIHCDSLPFRSKQANWYQFIRVLSQMSACLMLILQRFPKIGITKHPKLDSFSIETHGRKPPNGYVWDEPTKNWPIVTAKKRWRLSPRWWGAETFLLKPNWRSREFYICCFAVV